MGAVGDCTGIKQGHAGPLMTCHEVQAAHTDGHGFISDVVDDNHIDHQPYLMTVEKSFAPDA